MKTIVALAVIALATGAWALTIDQQKKAEAYAAECVKSTGVAPVTPAKLKKGEFAGADEKTKCFTKCVLEKAGFMNDKGDVQEKTVVDKLSVDHDKSKVEATLKKCNHKGSNACDTAFKMTECFYNTKYGLV
ncbi:general odorant-binding protein 56d-like [Toxorhynchites rutilus septentrionalis]|uniref:general odorant-binding protein 56d-like n=1 Tax=Toxorhynchites rutilus septentrionalis TaxID=329112 RepID=UPI0024790839|nr:general odorant-binding protein 56d-like [Toxorhynchites rutilus septentrionalis]